MLVSVSPHQNPIHGEITFICSVEAGAPASLPFSGPSTSTCQMEAHINDLQLQGLSWPKDTPAALPWWGRSFPGGILSVLGYKDPAPLPPFGAIPKGHPSSRALRGIRGLCYNTSVSNSLTVHFCFPPFFRGFVPETVSYPSKSAACRQHLRICYPRNSHFMNGVSTKFIC